MFHGSTFPIKEDAFMAEHPDTPKWKELASKELRGKPVESLNWKTPEGIVVKPLYTAEDLEALEHLNSLPGMPPYVRGATGSFQSP